MKQTAAWTALTRASGKVDMWDVRMVVQRAGRMASIWVGRWVEMMAV